MDKIDKIDASEETHHQVHKTHKHEKLVGSGNGNNISSSNNIISSGGGNGKRERELSFSFSYSKDVPRRDFPNSADGYTLIEYVGKGASGVVWHARCASLGEDVAIKVIDLEHCNTNIDELRKEISTMSLCHHPNVVNYHTSFIHNESLWLVMDYLAGGSCSDILRFAFPNGFEENIVATILRETLKGILYFHKSGRLHRDIKAGNILVDSTGDIRIADFGVSASLVETLDNSRHTFVGTPCWMAPEIVMENASYGEEVDIWSFGITALELAKGKAPFADYPPMKVLMLVAQNQPPSLDLDEHDKGRFSNSFRDLIEKCLQKDPAKRPSATKLIEHKFFKHAKKPDYIVAHLLSRLPSLGERYKMMSDVSNFNVFRDSTAVALAKEANNEPKKEDWIFPEESTTTTPASKTSTSTTSKSITSLQKDSAQNIIATHKPNGVEPEQSQVQVQRTGRFLVITTPSNNPTPSNTTPSSTSSSKSNASNSKPPVSPNSIPNGIHPTNSQNSLPNGTHPTNSQNSIPNGTHPTNSQNSTPNGAHPTNSQNSTPNGTHPINSQNSLPNGTYPANSQNSTPNGTHPINSQNSTPNGTHHINSQASNQSTSITPPIHNSTANGMHSPINSTTSTPSNLIHATPNNGSPNPTHHSNASVPATPPPTKGVSTDSSPNTSPIISRSNSIDGLASTSELRGSNGITGYSSNDTLLSSGMLETTKKSHSKISDADSLSENSHASKHHHKKNHKDHHHRHHSKSGEAAQIVALEQQVHMLSMLVQQSQQQQTMIQMLMAQMNTPAQTADHDVNQNQNQTPPLSQTQGIPPPPNLFAMIIDIQNQLNTLRKENLELRQENERLKASVSIDNNNHEVKQGR